MKGNQKWEQSKDDRSRNEPNRDSTNISLTLISSASLLH